MNIDSFRKLPMVRKETFAPIAKTLSFIEEVEMVAMRRYRSGGSKFALTYLKTVLKEVENNSELVSELKTLMDIYKRNV